jgi:GT2 family glycosyltransferase
MQTDKSLSPNRIAITAVVAAYNEERHIHACIEGLLNQQGVPGELEIIVVDGMSTDHTLSMIRHFPEYGTTLRVVQNPRRLQVYAWNLGLAAARGEYVTFVSAHAEYEPTYLASCLEVMKRTNATAVGGVPVAYGEEGIAKAIAWAMSSPFGMGNARFRYTTSEEETDTIFGIFTRRDTLERIGGFDERVPFDEDSELNYRLRRAGAKLVVSPAIGVRYHVRQSLKSLSKQMRRYGYWRRYTQLLHGGAVPARVMVPPAFLAALVLSLVLLATPVRALSAAIPLAYAAFAIFAAAKSIPRIGVAAVTVPIVLATMHVAYGAGWWNGFFRLGSAARSIRNKTAYVAKTE